MTRIAHVAAVDLTHRFLLLGQLRRLLELGYDVTAISADGPHVAALEEAGIRHIVWPDITRAWDVRSDARALAGLIRILRRERFDLVHTHNPKPSVIGRVAARIARVPCVVNTVHGLYAMPEDRWLKRAAVLGAEALTARCSHHEFYQSEEDLLWARRLHVAPAEKSSHLGNGTDLTFFAPAAVAEERRNELRGRLGVAPDEVVVGTVGRLVAEKGYRELFAAARLVRARLPAVRFLVVGSPDFDKADAISEEEIERARGDVVFTGWRNDVRDLLSAMDVFVLASWREGLPRSAIEAAAMGKALVLTDIRGCREVARDGHEALLVPPRDTARLARAIEKLASDADARKRMGLAARARAEGRFDEERVFGQIARTYEQVLAKRGLEHRPGRAKTRIRRAAVSDAPALARLHRDSLPDAFLPTLGERFLRLMYRELVRDSEAVVLVAEKGAEVVGFVAGVRSVRNFYRRFLMGNAVAAVVVTAPRLVRPSTLRRIYETARYPTAGPSLPDAELLSVAVAGSSRARGVGKELADRLLAELAAMGVRRVKVVVAEANDGANAFYARIGFGKATKISVHKGTSSNVWIYECPSSSRSA